jgi:hypothetical protein
VALDPFPVGTVATDAAFPAILHLQAPAPTTSSTTA